MGKIIGGGLPVGAYGGPSEIMDLIAPLGPVYQAGTLSGNPLAMAAGYATVSYLRDHKEVYAKLDKLASEVVAGVAAAAKDAGVTMCHNRVGSMFTWFFAEGPVTDWSFRRQIRHRSLWTLLPRNARQRNLPAAFAIRSGIPGNGAYRA